MGRGPGRPCATFPARDTRATTPVAPGVVLIGDAAGYENPLLGQGLSMALRDVRDVADALTTAGAWNERVFDEYVVGRRRRHHVAKLATTMEGWVNDGYEHQDPAIRTDRRERVYADELLTAVDATVWRGYDSIDADAAERAIANLLAATEPPS